ncbi:hypothetical protein [Microbacterium enclense]|uniref:Uncharacterized protein n=1 Tax=Microbacterium enclense TaxID=993073 RepID=A0A1G6NS36_9MICO|nr:hypothetical protein [Microbacterium enclense]KSU52879.1 hypothetical protein AS029_12785 [Microbacterium enclense]SDC70752.1 hypothetical protein SAMN05216418_2836 [Microbacterium enclense]
MTASTVPTFAAWHTAAEESFDRMRAHAVEELSALLGEDVHLDETGAIVLDEDQRDRLLAAVPTTTAPGFPYETAWGVPIRRAEADALNHPNGSAS